jgi:hypothetical protein
VDSQTGESVSPDSLARWLIKLTATGRVSRLEKLNHTQAVEPQRDALTTEDLKV